jgi:hypothetical protein
MARQKFSLAVEEKRYVCRICGDAPLLDGHAYAMRPAKRRNALPP